MKKNEISFVGNDADLSAEDFLGLAQRVWPGQYNTRLTDQALNRTINVTAWHAGVLVGCVRVLTDGYFFGTIPELLVDPDFQGQTVGRGLMERAWKASPTSLYFGAQPGKEGFYESLGYERSLTSYGRKKPRPE